MPGPLLTIAKAMYKLNISAPQIIAESYNQTLQGLIAHNGQVTFVLVVLA